MASLTYYGTDTIETIPSTITTSDKSFDIEAKWKFTNGLETTDLESEQLLLSNNTETAVAERFNSDTEMAVGSIVEFGGTDEITLASHSSSKKVFGVIVEEPAIGLRNVIYEHEDQPYPFVCWSGRTKVRVTGQINKFDKIYVSEDNAGIGTNTVTSEDKCVGIALEAKLEAEEGLVDAFIQGKIF